MQTIGTTASLSAAPPATPQASDTFAPVAALIGSMCSLMIGTSFAKHLFPAVGAAGTISYRIVIAALILVVLRRPWRHRLSRRDAGAVALYGVTLGAMNLMFYMALRTIPMGLTIAIEFVGPLTVALLASRRAFDFLWIGLAVLGLGLLLPIGVGASSLDPVGVAFALGAAVMWGLYIVFGQRVGHLAGGQAVAIGMVCGSLFVLPFGIAGAGSALLDPALIASGVVVAVMSSAVPYSLEMFALRQLPRQTFGVLLSLEPAIGSLAGLAILGEHLTGREWIAIACVVAASAGSALGFHRSRRGARRPVCPVEA